MVIDTSVLVNAYRVRRRNYLSRLFTKIHARILGTECGNHEACMWDVISCRLVQMYRLFEGTYLYIPVN